jgi:hypothetical protein
MEYMSESTIDSDDTQHRRRKRRHCRKYYTMEPSYSPWYGLDIPEDYERQVLVDE